MIWLVWRRYRVLYAITVVLVVGLGVWMISHGHSSNAVQSSGTCGIGGFGCTTRSGVFSLSDQATAINLILLALPCILGVIFGAPLVAGELEHYTNRLTWTQGVSRTKWLLVKWCVTGLFLVLLAIALTLVSQWWTGQAGARDLNLWLAGGRGRIQPVYFPITGLVFTAYTVFAFAGGAAVGAVLRKTSWAIVGTVALYLAIAVPMVLFVRPSLSPQAFFPIHESSTGQGLGAPSNVPSPTSWNLGFGYRYVPGAAVRTQLSPDAVGRTCQRQFLADEYRPEAYLHCLSEGQIQQGTFYQPANRYWTLQWRESALLLLAAAVLLAGTVWSVRRWRAYGHSRWRGWRASRRFWTQPDRR